MEDAGLSLMYSIIIKLQYNNVWDIQLSWFMAVREQICLNYSVKVRVNLILMCCMCECVYVSVYVCVVYVCDSKTQSSSGDRKCEQVNPLLVGLHHHMEGSQPPVVQDTRYCTDWAWWETEGWERNQGAWSVTKRWQDDWMFLMSSVWADLAWNIVGCFYFSCLGELSADWLYVLLQVLPGTLFLSDCWVNCTNLSEALMCSDSLTHCSSLISFAWLEWIKLWF